MDTVQQAAATIIAKVLSGRNLNQLINETNAALPQLNPQQRGALQDLSYGTLRYYGQLNNILDQLLLKPVQDMQIRFLLLVALYQLQYTKAAQHAVVDFAVTSMRNINPSAGGLVNAILRNFLRKKNELLDIATRTETGRYSYPQWWITEIKSQYEVAAENILLSGNQHPPMTLRINRKQTTTQAYLVLLAQNAINAKIIAPDAIILEQPQNVNKLPGFNEGMVSVQDAGAQYAAQFLDVQNGMLVLDACAAPGGKSAHLLESAEIELVALDKDELRLQRVRDNMQRLHLDANICAGDAAKPADWWDGRKFQRILADVPCSATGVVRRHPDIKWLRRPSDIEHFAGQQQEILAALWPLLQAGGKLLYATCSIFDRENQQVINQFLGLHSDATQLALSAPDMISGQLLPTDLHDGFFYALLQKQK
jgi:16S rRNA (cytosine967-C5)-methyltransferase